MYLAWLPSGWIQISLYTGNLRLHGTVPEAKQKEVVNLNQSASLPLATEYSFLKWNLLIPLPHKEIQHNRKSSGSVNYQEPKPSCPYFLPFVNKVVFKKSVIEPVKLKHSNWKHHYEQSWGMDESEEKKKMRKKIVQNKLPHCLAKLSSQSRRKKRGKTQKILTATNKLPSLSIQCLRVTDYKLGLTK